MRTDALGANVAVSVIIPTYNRGEFLQRSIASALGQTLQDFEILVVDDGSFDGTQRLVESFGDERIKYIRHEANRGVATARNTGILNARGWYIAFLDDDDEWFPEKLQLQFTCLQRSPTNIGAVYTGSLGVDGRTGKVISTVQATLRGQVFEAMFTLGSIAPTSTFFCRRQCFERVGLFDPAFKYAEDFDMWLRIAREFAFEYIARPLVRFVIHTDEVSLSANYDVMIRGKEEYLQRYADLFSRYRRVHSHYHVKLGVLHCYNNDMSRGRAAFRRAIRINPFDARAYFNLSLSVAGAKQFRRLKALKEHLWTS